MRFRRTLAVLRRTKYLTPSYVHFTHEADTKTEYAVKLYRLDGESEFYTDHFTPLEFRCKCNYCRSLVPVMVPLPMLVRAELVRRMLDRPTVISSAFRCQQHPIEVAKVKKGKPMGTHSRMEALDFVVHNDAEAYKVIHFGITVLDCTGFSYNQEDGFVHLDWMPDNRRTWNY